MEVWNPKHTHHAAWREYTQSLLDGKPKVLEIKEAGKWVRHRGTLGPAWVPDCEYRIARPMLTLAYSVPMPVTEPLKKGQEYWLAYANEDGKADDGHFIGDNKLELNWLRAGLIYLTEADAKAAIDARNAAMTAALEDAK